VLLFSLVILGCSDGGTTTTDLAAVAPADMSVKSSSVLATIRGKLKNDVATSKMIHNTGAMAAKAGAMMLGDFGHYVFLNLPTPDAGTASDSLLIIDEWMDAANAMKFYSDPNLQASFGQLFSGPPEVSLHTVPSDWSRYGKVNPAGQGASLYLFSIRGPLSTSQAEPGYYNGLADGGKAMAMAAGNLSLNAYLRLDDPKQVLLLSMWNNLANALQIENDPTFLPLLAKMFSAAPDSSAYVHSDWVEW
jgi:hypothetical protein